MGGLIPLGDLEACLDQHPPSAWALALQANLVILCVSQAWFGKARDWLDVVNKHKEYQACVTVATANWEKAIEITLQQLLKQ
ncbi:hypothetical protein RIE95_06670 [Acidithiobacillus thiooxidans]|uniref:Uncharacterized protein n=1 Tax=Acidithiobacillus thiooxidans ATCC 19377 TaxID=637390 RepID=A0A543Q3T5_ACITH|nr:hypothetical protein [Acidithiobacillus thiooxidans]MDR7926677.1 hypothetical protein [Acidithiobacillus thiooxidans]MDX5934917.1 hypothetical protein [Acidithiobacillus thiooxidans]TQN50958.1 hypothetical protein DLNHIDIE_00820 [Acidithiobacillus thiooxidans ATCC 19377]